MEPLKRLNGTITELPRGGYLVQTKAGYIQFGSPPETIKDTMMLPESVPQIYVLPRKLFNPDKGISLAELEFPIYFNFFVKKRKTHIIGTKEQGNRLIRVLREAVFGPAKVDISQDIYPESKDAIVHDLKKEMSYYKTFVFRDLLSFHFLRANSVKYNGTVISVDSQGDFNVIEDGKEIAHIPGTINYKARFNIGERLAEPYVTPLAGITCLGPSHGFDPTENTSGYIIWLNHRGIMVDPPVNSTEWLTNSNVNPKLIDSIILTHCHADHDAGTFQKIMEEERVTIYTTKTIMSSFLRKYSALSDEPTASLSRLFNFHPICLGKPFYIHGAEFNALYSLHSIPTIGFTMNFQGNTFVYSSDHQGEKKVHDLLLSKGVINQARYDQLQNFPWDSDVIYHESGIPPLHSSIDWLNSLPEKIKRKTVVYHIARKDFPNKTNLTLARFGIEHTLTFRVKPPRFEKTYEILGLLRHLDFFQGFSLEKIQEFLLAIREEKFKKGSTIIRRGTRGDRFYIIYSGNVDVYVDGLEQKKIYGAFEYFGELGLITNNPTAADVVAETDVVAYTIAKDQFLSFIAGTELEESLKNLVKMRDKETWNILSTSPHFNCLTSFQKTWLESVLQPLEIVANQTLVKKGQSYKGMYIIRNGEVEVKSGNKIITKLGRGDFIGSLREIDENLPSPYTFKNRGRVSLYFAGYRNMRSFAEKNPGLIMKLMYDF
jgi:CRP-like cAMP-binding protein/phosphoribosyl 1,2-cyclic phosphodiesterase